MKKGTLFRLATLCVLAVVDVTVMGTLVDTTCCTCRPLQLSLGGGSRDLFVVNSEVALIFNRKILY